MAMPAGAQLASSDCLGCHDQINARKFTASIHGSLECTNCHADVTAVPHEIRPKAVECASCHADAVAAWNNSLHARAVREGNARGARCLDCHGPAHEILPSTDNNARTFHQNVPQTCSRCHAQKFVMEKAGLTPQPALSYQESVHGRAVARGSTKAAVCTDCHDYHDVRAANDPQSQIFKFNVGRTCGKCHAAIAGQYGGSVHGIALARGNWNAPICTDCHGIHTIARAADPARGPRSSCAHCHEGVRLTQEFAVPANRVSSYQASYHGLARQMGSPIVADCASCHGAHDIRPSADPRSAVNRANLPRTCGKCHQGATANFVRGKIHLTATDVSDVPSRVNTWIRRIYIVLIVVTIGLMALHNLIIWYRKAQWARRRPGRTVLRMNLNQRVQHIVLFSSFTVLVISGFALAWPQSFFAVMLGSSEPLRRVVHRVAAVIMIVLGLYHLAYMTLTKEGRQGLRDLWFRFKDGKDAAGVMRYYLGLTSSKPQFARFSYAEKAEYWAGLWGTMVMAITGLMIWYNVAVATWIPRWWIDIATTIHFYEAVLATLAILIWHFYHVIFDPDVYPMNWTWFDGKMTEEQFHEEHALASAVTAEKKEDEGE